ncbi:hypothetical protein B0H14DRAFT_3160826 [Mycena olivaceomarginata]|nr:hypothetical protein B0H14DRAFT_3160826 [Mycena olivaceomarginata]
MFDGQGDNLEMIRVMVKNVFRRLDTPLERMVLVFVYPYKDSSIASRALVTTPTTPGSRLRRPRSHMRTSVLAVDAQAAGAHLCIVGDTKPQFSGQGLIFNIGFVATAAVRVQRAVVRITLTRQLWETVRRRPTEPDWPPSPSLDSWSLLETAITLTAHFLQASVQPFGLAEAVAADGAHNPARLSRAVRILSGVQSKIYCERDCRNLRVITASRKFDRNEADQALLNPKLQQRSGLVESDSTKGAKIQRVPWSKRTAAPVTSRKSPDSSLEPLPGTAAIAAGQVSGTFGISRRPVLFNGSNPCRDRAVGEKKERACR